VTCPKCDSKNVVQAPDEAPSKAVSWMKCFACGKRWDAAGVLAKELERVHEEDDPKLVTTESDDDPDAIALAMEDVHCRSRVTRGKDRVMSSHKCSVCTKDAQPGKKMCAGHLQAAREYARARYQRLNGMQPKERVTQKKAAGGQPRDLAPTQVVAVVNGHLAKPGRRVDPTGQFLVLLDAAIATHRNELRTLECAREIVARHQ